MAHRRSAANSSPQERMSQARRHARDGTELQPTK
jgi:hypothetical protein